MIAWALVHSAHKHTPDIPPLFRLNLQRSLAQFASADQQEGKKIKKKKRKKLGGQEKLDHSAAMK